MPISEPKPVDCSSSPRSAVIALVVTIVLGWILTILALIGSYRDAAELGRLESQIDQLREDLKATDLMGQELAEELHRLQMAKPRSGK